MGINLLLNSINIGLAIHLYREKLVIYTPNYCIVNNTITSSTVTSHHIQLIKSCYAVRNLSSCELFSCIDVGVDGVMLERSSWGCLADLTCCGRGCSVSCDRFRHSLWFSCGFGSRTPCCLAAFLLLLLIVCQTLPL